MALLTHDATRIPKKLHPLTDSNDILALIALIGTISCAEGAKRPESREIVAVAPPPGGRYILNVL